MSFEYSGKLPDQLMVCATDRLWDRPWKDDNRFFNNAAKVSTAVSYLAVLVLGPSTLISWALVASGLLSIGVILFYLAEGNSIEKDPDFYQIALMLPVSIPAFVLMSIILMVDHYWRFIRWLIS